MVSPSLAFFLLLPRPPEAAARLGQTQPEPRRVSGREGARTKNRKWFSAPCPFFLHPVLGRVCLVEIKLGKVVIVSAQNCRVPIRLYSPAN